MSPNNKETILEAVDNLINSLSLDKSPLTRSQLRFLVLSHPDLGLAFSRRKVRDILGLSRIAANMRRHRIIKKCPHLAHALSNLGTPIMLPLNNEMGADDIYIVGDESLRVQYVF
jgi:hypothetical protein